MICRGGRRTRMGTRSGGPPATRAEDRDGQADAVLHDSSVHGVIPQQLLLIASPGWGILIGLVAWRGHRGHVRGRLRPGSQQVSSSRAFANPCFSPLPSRSTTPPRASGPAARPARAARAACSSETRPRAPHRSGGTDSTRKQVTKPPGIGREPDREPDVNSLTHADFGAVLPAHAG